MGAVLELLDVVYIIEDDDRRDRTQQFRAKQYDLAFRNRGKRIILLGIAFDKVSIISPTGRSNRSDVAIFPQLPYLLLGKLPTRHRGRICRPRKDDFGMHCPDGRAVAHLILGLVGIIDPR